MKVNIGSELKAGDKIRRIANSWGRYVRGEEYTFKNYYMGSDVEVEENGDVGAIVGFEFVSRPNVVYVTTFEKAVVGDKVWDFRYGWGEIQDIKKESHYEYPLFVAFNNGNSRSFTLTGKEFAHNNTTLFWDEIVFEIPTKEIRESVPKAKFIEAMRKTAIEYIEGTHEFNHTKCALCAIVKEYKQVPLTDQDNVWYRSKEGCDICPWVVITGECCEEATDNLARAKELLDWVKKYEAMED